MFGIGPIELVMILAVLLLLIGLPLAIVLLVVLPKKSRGGPNVCPACQGRYAGSARFCPHCGTRLEG